MEQSNNLKVIGFTGFFGAGKGTALSLVSKLTNASIYSTSEEISLELIKLGLPTDRFHKYELANKRREEFGAGYWALRVVDKINLDINPVNVCLVDALRNVGEIEILKESFKENFILFSIEAPIKLRYSRILSRHRDSNDLLSYDDFIKSEEKENKPNPSKFEQSLSACALLADFHIDNSTSINELCIKLSSILTILKIPVIASCSQI